ncbi:MAG: phage head-tail connector protein [Cytophagales bacterium]|nr:phage head-tail connector protein [Cytophagales bacterium]
MSERLTYGFAINATELEGESEPIAIPDVKAKLGITFSNHDTRIDMLITAVREAVEERFGKSLTGKAVSVFWLSFYDDLPLPYSPLAANPELTVTDLDDVTIESGLYKVYEVGGRSIFKGDFPNGVKLSYKTKPLNNNRMNALLIDTVGDCLNTEMSIPEAITKNFKYANF